MTLENEKFRVTIEEDPCYTIDSADNKPYDIVWNPLGLNRRDYSRALAVKVWQEEQTYCGLLLVSINSFCGENCAVLTGDRLTGLWDEGLIQLDLFSREIIFCKSLLDWGYVLAIFPCPEDIGGYVIYSEMDVLKLNSDFEVEWRTGIEAPVEWQGSVGRRAVSIGPFVNIAMTEERILLDDWEGNHYELDYRGNMLLFQPGTSDA